MGNSIADAMAKAGGPAPVEVEFTVQLSRMVERAMERGASASRLADACEGVAKRLRGEGRIVRASDGHLRPANPAQTERDGEASQRVPKGQNLAAEPSQPIADGTGLDHISLTEAARVMRKAQPGAGAMQHRAFETRAQFRGESWLVAYQIPGGRKILDLTWDDAAETEKRMFREGGERLLSCVVLGALRREAANLGLVTGHMEIGKTLTPATIAKVADEFEPEKLHAKGRALFRQFQKEEISHA